MQEGTAVHYRMQYVETEGTPILLVTMNCLSYEYSYIGKTIHLSVVLVIR